MNHKPLQDRILDARRAAVRQELIDFLDPKVEAYSDYDEWGRGEDPDNYDYALGLVNSCVGVFEQPLTRSDREHLLESLWDYLQEEMYVAYAESAAFERECDLDRPDRPYADRRGW